MQWIPKYLLGCAFGFALAASSLAAQDEQTLADIRQELSMLFVEMQKLRRELSTTGAGSVAVTGVSVLDRLDAMESELQRLTANAERMDNRIERIVADGTNRIGDLEFRLVELEGGDVSLLGQTTTLGGDLDEPAKPELTAPAASPTGASLAVGEEADFNRAREALAQGDLQAAATLFEAFNQTYPGGPLAAEADLRRGEALSGLGNTREAARAFLSSFSAAPQGNLAPDALFQLGRALGALGQTQEACVTLSEVSLRFPDSSAVIQAEDQRRGLGCS
ncbi:MAG: tol-pal system protein YbgF [Pseudomonadota bacterium]